MTSAAFPLTAALASEVVSADIDEAARRAARNSLIDTVACVLAAAESPDLPAVSQWARSARGEAHALGHLEGFAPGAAALLGGFQAHLLDFDDVHPQLRGHPSAVLWPALIALGGPSSRLVDLLDGLVVGVDVAARIGELVSTPGYPSGWHPTAVVGPVAAAAAGARLRGLDAQTAARAIGMAASQAGGLRTQFGTPGKPLQAGIAARAGTDAVLWASAGLRAAPDALEAAHGFLHAFGGSPPAPGALAGFGHPWRIASPGIWVKPFPFCAAAMALSDAAQAVGRQLRDLGLEPDAVTSIRILQGPGADGALIHRRPATGEQGRFSAEYVAALRLSGIRPTLPWFDSRPIAQDLAGLAARAHRISVPGRERSWAKVEAITERGAIAAEVRSPHGSAANPLDAAELADKLRENCPGTVDAKAILHAISDPAARLSDLLQAVTGIPRPRSGTHVFF